MTGSDLSTTLHIKQNLDKIFNINDLWELSYFLGIEVSYLPQGIALTQAKFTKELLANCDLNNTKPVVTPLSLNLKVAADDGHPLDDPTRFRCMLSWETKLSHTH